jgi:hypothetical protein
MNEILLSRSKPAMQQEGKKREWRINYNEILIKH